MGCFISCIFPKVVKHGKQSSRDSISRSTLVTYFQSSISMFGFTSTPCPYKLLSKDVVQRLVIDLMQLAILAMGQYPVPCQLKTNRRTTESYLWQHLVATQLLIKTTSRK